MRTKNYLSTSSSGYATVAPAVMMQKQGQMKSYYATNSGSLAHAIGRKKSVTAVAR